MPRNESQRLKQLLEDLTGQSAPLLQAPRRLRFPKSGLGYSQLNELLLLLGYDRVTRSFFQFLADGKLDYKSGCALRSIDELERGVQRVGKLSLLMFGNVKFGFKKLGRDLDELRFYCELTEPIKVGTLKRRHNPIHPIDPIPADQTYYLGYLVRQELNAKLKRSRDKAAQAQMRVLKETVGRGVRNHHAYLVSDHLDVYVATSMRKRHEYMEVADFTRKLFQHRRLRGLKLRWFDPTQAYCSDRVDKGLSEALMLKRATCTLYLAQESDTLGKDSELASTLAQGKPVIAYVPSPTAPEVRASIRQLAAQSSAGESKVIFERLQALAPGLAWTDKQLRKWLDAPNKVDQSRALHLLAETTLEHYDKRARDLREKHPLGIQVNLETGVANGVLVVRTVNDCAELIYRIVTRRLRFHIEKKKVRDVTYHFLREDVSKSIFRVMTGDAMLTNSFWNFYLEPSE